MNAFCPAFLGPGAIVGEMSIIDQLPRSANVVAVRPAVLSFLSRTDFQDFARKHPQVYESLVALLAARLRETDTTIAAGTFLPLRGRVACTLLEVAQECARQDLGAATSKTLGSHPSVTHTSHTRHSNVCNSAKPPIFGIERTNRRIATPQLGQHGAG